jgi:ribokinase
VDGVFGWPPPAGPQQTWLATLRSNADGPTIGAFRHRHGPPPWPPEWDDVAGLHLAPHAAAQQAALARQARAAGVRVVTCDPQAHVQAQDALLQAVDAFLPSERELHAWVPQAAPADALAMLARRCAAQLAVKLGARGVLWWDRAAGTARHLPAIAVEAPDPTGAGDAFCGGVLAGLVLGEDFPRALWRGTVAASFAVEHAGADTALAAASPKRFRIRFQQEPLAA